MVKSFYRQVNTEFNIFNKHNGFLLNKHQFVLSSTDVDGSSVRFGLLLPSMVKNDKTAFEPYLDISSLNENKSDPADLDNLHVMLLEYLDQALDATYAFQTGQIEVPDESIKDSAENLFYIYQWYANIRSELFTTDLYELPSELDDRCTDESVQALYAVADSGAADPELVDEFAQDGKFLVAFFGNVFPLIASNKDTPFNDILKAFMRSKLNKPQAKSYKRNGFANAEFNHILEEFEEEQY